MASAGAPAGATNAPRLLNGKVVLQVFLLDNSYKTLLIEPSATVGDVCRAMAEKIGFADAEEDCLSFGLCECVDGVTIQRALPPEREVLGVMEAWYEKPAAKFVFQVKLYNAALVASKDPKVVHLMFIQAVYNVVTGAYPTAEKDAVALAALQFQAKFGQHNAASHKPGFLKNMLVEFVPGAHLDEGRAKATPPEAWEKLIFHKHAFSTTPAPRELYLETLRKREYYGAALFAVKQRFDRALPKRVYMAVGRQGILLLRIPAKFTEPDMDVLARYNLADIYRWAYKAGTNFYFEIRVDGSEMNPVYSFDTPEGKHVSDLLTDYAMALLREMGLNPDGTARAKGKQGAPKVEGGPGGAPGGAAPAGAAPAGDAALPTLVVASTRSGEYAEGGGGAIPPPPPPAAGTDEPAAPHAPAGAHHAVVAAAAGDAGGAAAAAAAAAGGDAFDKPLPEHWIRVKDDASGEYYFFQTQTGEAAWTYEELPKS